LRSEIIFN